MAEARTETRKVNIILKRAPRPEREDRKKNVAVYCRVSTSHDEQVHSFNAQLSYYSSLYKDSEEWSLYRIYADEGISGTQVKNRTQFLQMIDDCEKGLIDCIVTKSISRFGRNTVDTLNYTRKLKDMGIDVYFEKEGIHSINAEGELMLSILSMLAETESVNISESVKWGVRRCYEKGKTESLTLGKFYGYHKKGKEIQVVEKEAEVVRRIYHDFLDGYGIEDIVRSLIDEGVPTDTLEGQWCDSTVKKMLSNEKYMGDCLFQKTFISDPITHRRIKNNGELNKYYVEDCFPQIVDKGLWNLVQLEMQRQKEYTKKHNITRYHSNTESFPFSSRIICGVCGGTYRLYAHKVKSMKGEKYLRCSTFIRGKWTEVNGVMFTPRGRPRRTEHPKNKSYKHKPPVPRTMRCTDVEIPYERPFMAFADAWNYLADNPDILASHAASCDLQAYRLKELQRLIAVNGRVKSASYDLVRQTLECMVVNPDGSITVRFLAGIEI